MEFLKTLKDEEPFNLQKIRKGSRAILFDENNLIPLLYVSKYKYHKLPGGGIDEGEDNYQALKREVLEETGCKIEISGEIGEILEYRSEYGLKYNSYCYFGKILSKGKPNFTEKEIEQGFKIVWMNFNEALKIIEKENPKHYTSNFIHRRELIFLKKAKELLDK